MEINKLMTRTHRAAATSRYALSTTPQAFLVGSGSGVSATGVVRARGVVCDRIPVDIAPFFTTRVIRSAPVEPILT
ncbi:hypothetical protein [Branchiibius sp. NY16-3462-2]|uniref:hypothetical protein n=1 Tax=Branchiibius sp. NY16-3462-2 TaxID=1807500 RepID=UPI000793DA44|nr:hypothetical protein [Branchiibius sp. NY16-3462-2]KYH45948.1 hypothetical protein AZH51_09785 [Branchiibius sp. NY16-3462-2]